MAARPDIDTRSSGFFWQGVLILLPVFVLAVIGGLSIHQDRTLVQREAAERAQSLADEIAEAFWAALTVPSRPGGELEFQVDAAGRLVFPPPADALPKPAPFALQELTPEQSRLWTDRTRDIATDPTHAVAAAREFLATHPPARFEAAMRFQLARSLSVGGDAAGAREIFAELSRESPLILGETGLPLAPLARLKWIELAEAGDRLRAAEINALRSGALSNPSPMTPFLLRRAAELDGSGAGRWQTEWDRHEFLRRLHDRSLEAVRRGAGSNVSPVLPRFIWFNTDDAHPALWRATRASTNAFGALFDCRLTLAEWLLPPDVLASRAPGPISGTRRSRAAMSVNLYQSFSVDLTNALSEPFPVAVLAAYSRLPGYFGLSLDVAGRALISSNDLSESRYVSGGKGGGQYWKNVVPARAPALVAQARRFDEGVEAIRVGIHLTSPEMLYDRQRSRTLLFSLLILVSAAVAVAGYIAARRAFLRTQQLSEMKSNFVSSVSHELRAPIASVRLMAENLERGKVADPAKQHDYFRFITQECRRLSSLIENVLDFARIEQGRKQYDFEPTDIAALVEQTVKLMEPAAAGKNVTLRIDAIPRGAESPLGAKEASEKVQRAEPGLGAPRVDAQAIQQALINLLDNAIKHSRNAATVTIALSLNPELSTLNLSVADTGPGIPPGEHERIFERFYRRGSELRRETPGVGIGLSIVKHVAEAHGGRVIVESAVGQGSRFTLELPCGQKVGENQNPKSKTQGKLK